jgi:hypothetical protein
MAMILALAGPWLFSAMYAAEDGSDIDLSILHTDPDAMREGIAEAFRGFIDEDGAAVRAALDRVDQACRMPKAEDTEPFGKTMISVDKQLHLALALAREDATAGQLDRSLTQVYLIVKACVECHQSARERGLLVDSVPALDGQ